MSREGKTLAKSPPGKHLSMSTCTNADSDLPTAQSSPSASTDSLAELDHIVSFPHIAKLTQNEFYNDLVTPPDLTVFVRPTSMDYHYIITKQKPATVSRSSSKLPLSDSSEQTSPPEPARPLSSRTIWNNCDKFLGTVPSYSSISSLFQERPMPPAPKTPGEHYSVAINKMLKTRYGDKNISIKIPQFISRKPQALVHRVLAALVEIDPLDDVEVMDYQCESIRNHVDINYSRVTPTNFPGTSLYSRLPVEKKLEYELTALAIEPTGTTQVSSDSEVLNDLMTLQQQLNELIRKSQPLKDLVLERIKDSQDVLQQRQERSKRISALRSKPEEVSRKAHTKSKKRSQ